MTRLPDPDPAGSPGDSSPPPALETVLDLLYLQPFTRRPGPLRHLVQTFLDSSAPIPHRLALASARHDHPQVQELLHELHGAAQGVGARLLESTCQRLLARSPTSLEDRSTAVAAEIAAALQPTRAAFAQFLDGLPPASEPASGRPPAPTTLLVLEDSATLRALLRNLLADDYRLIEADTGRAALAACAGEPPPDLLLADLNLGASSGQENDLSGLDVVRRLKGAIPCVVLTVDRSRETRRAAIQAGAWAYLIKPPESDALHAALETALARARDAARAAAQRVNDVATGLLMAHHHLDVDEARALLKALASDDRRPVRDVAEALIGAQQLHGRIARLAGRKTHLPPESA